MILITAVIYFLVARLSLLLALGNTNASPVWPPSGIALAVILLWGYRMGPAVFLGAFFANMFILQNSGFDHAYYIITSLTTATGNMLEGIIGVYFIRRFTAADNPFENIKDLFIFIIPGSLVSTMISSSIGVVSFCTASGKWSLFGQIWLTWWLGDAAGILIVSPVIILLKKMIPGKVYCRHLPETAIMFFILIVSSVIIFRNNYRIEYIIIPPLLWIALRSGRVLSAGAVLLVSGIAITCSINTADLPGSNVSLLFLQTYIGVISVITLCLSVLAHEQSETDRSRIAIQKQLYDIIEFLPDATFAIDINRNVIAWNRTMEELSCILKKDIMGKSEYEYTIPFSGESNPVLIDLVMKYTDPVLPGTYKNIKKKGTVLTTERYNPQMNRYFSDAASALIDGNGIIYGAIQSVRDITERKLTELELNHYRDNLEEIIKERNAELLSANEQLTMAKERAEAADRLKSAFLATMSHELRTPLNSIIGFTGVIIQGLAGPLNNEQKKQMNMVRKSAQHLLSLINDVLDISKIEAGLFEIYSETFDLKSVIEKTATILEPDADKKGVVINIDIRNELGEIWSDRRRVEQVLINLLSNAIKFTERGTVTISAELIFGYKPPFDDRRMNPVPAVQFRISDTGIGIHPDDLHELFQPFRQVDTGLARKNEGTGLGLSICRRLATLLGGEVNAESVLGHGSVFTFIIPVEKRQE